MFKQTLGLDAIMRNGGGNLAARQNQWSTVLTCKRGWAEMGEQIEGIFEWGGHWRETLMLAQQSQCQNSANT